MIGKVIGMGVDGMRDRPVRMRDTLVAVCIWLVVPALTAAAYMLLAVPVRSMMAWFGLSVSYWVALAVLLTVVSVIIVAAFAWAVRHDSTD